MRVHVFQLGSTDWGFWICAFGYLGILLALIVERLAKTHGWQAAKRCSPVLAVVVILAGLAIVRHHQGLRAYPTFVQVKQAGEIFCDGWMYYGNFLCWLAP